jgi:hypothetical protein
MAEDLLDYWVKLIRTMLPENVWITTRYVDCDYLIQIDWKLKNDPENPNKRSRKIEIIIKEDAIENYLDKSKEERELSDILLKEFIYQRVNHAKTDNDVGTDRYVPKGKWLISQAVLNCSPSSEPPGDQVKSVYQYQR